MKQQLKLLLCVLIVTWSPVQASVIYSTSFESPEFVTGAFPEYSNWGPWGVMSASSIQNSVALSGSQAVQIDASVAGNNQSGIWTWHENSGQFVTVSADVYLLGSSTPTAWQFATGDENESGGFFVGGFNPLTDGRLELITAGFPVTTSVISRNTWNNYKAIFDIQNQTFDVFINNALVAGDVPFLNPATSVRQFQFDTFGRSGSPNDRAYIDNFLFEAVPEPMRGLMLMMGVIAIHLRRRR